jgi:hypothetical protein
VEARELLQQQNQIEIIFRAVETHPREMILTVRSLVEGLMLMPNEGDVEGVGHIVGVSRLGLSNASDNSSLMIAIAPRFPCATLMNCKDERMP